MSERAEAVSPSTAMMAGALICTRYSIGSSSADIASRMSACPWQRMRRAGTSQMPSGRKVADQLVHVGRAGHPRGRG